VSRLGHRGLTDPTSAFLESNLKCAIAQLIDRSGIAFRQCRGDPHRRRGHQGARLTLGPTPSELVPDVGRNFRRYQRLQPAPTRNPLLEFRCFRSFEEGLQRRLPYQDHLQQLFGAGLHVSERSKLGQEFRLRSMSIIQHQNGPGTRSHRLEEAIQPRHQIG
jgi:hypothetical protein